MKSPTLPGVTYDLIYQEACDASEGLRDVESVWQIEWHYGIFLNPVGCTTTRNGILEFRCAA